MMGRQDQMMVNWGLSPGNGSSGNSASAAAVTNQIQMSADLERG